MSNRNEIELKATPTSAVTIGNGTYTPDQVGVFEGDIDSDDVAPYLEGMVAAVLLAQRGRFALHANAVRIAGSAVAGIIGRTRRRFAAKNPATSASEPGAMTSVRDQPYRKPGRPP